MTYLSMDQGGTKTCVLACDETGRILGVGHAQGACWNASGEERTLAACEAALSDAGFTWTADALCAGMTGLDWPEDYDSMRAAVLKRSGVDRLILVNDCVAAFWGGAVLGRGACVCAGTGTNACFVRGDGTSQCLGFYMHVPHIAHEALNAVADCASGIGCETRITEAALDYFKAMTVDELLKALSAGSYTPGYVKRFAPAVLELAGYDATATTLCDAFARRCARYAAAMLTRGDMAAACVDVVASGGIFKGAGGRLFDVFAQEVHRLAPAARPVNALYEPVVGAMRMLLTPEAWQRLKTEAESFNLKRLKGN